MIDERRKEERKSKEFSKKVQLLIILWYGLFECLTVFREPIFSFFDDLQIQAVHHK